MGKNIFDKAKEKSKDMFDKPTKFIKDKGADLVDNAVGKTTEAANAVAKKAMDSSQTKFVKNKASQVGDAMMDKAKDVLEKPTQFVKDKTEDLKDVAKDKANEIGGHVRNSAKEFAKEVISETLDEKIRGPFIKRDKE